jgi:Zn-dependent protease with chaperone function
LKKYEAIIIHPEVKGGRCSGELEISFSDIIFTSEEISYKFSLNNLAINAGGAGNRYIFLKDLNQDIISIYTSDKSIFKDSNIISNEKLANEIKKSKNTINKPLIIVGIVLMIIILGITSLFFFKDKMVEGIANQVPKEWEKTAGDKLFNTMSLQYHFIKNDSLKKEFLKVAAPLFKQVEKDGTKIEIYFVKDPTINAFALPGGKVIIQTGLIQNAETWEEVLGVLGHELAHVTRRHHVRGIINNIGIFAILSAAFGDVSALAGTFANMGGELASLSNSRDFENEADETGLKYLENAQINPQGMVTFFETLKKEHQTELDSTLNKTVDLSFLSTHPNTQDRIDNLKKQIKNYPNKNYITLANNFKSFKEALLKKED